jgi:hypothetical protein
MEKQKIPQYQEVSMTEVTLTLEPCVALFYSRLAQSLNLPLEQVLTDALFKLAGELSLEALQTSLQ